MQSGNDEFKIIFGIYDFDCPHNEITKAIGLKPDRIKVKGDQELLGKGNRQLAKEVKENAWLLEWRPASETTLNDDLNSILVDLESAMEGLRTITSKYYSEISIVGYYYSVNPGLHIDNKGLTTLAGMGVALDIDLYFMGIKEA